MPRALLGVLLAALVAAPAAAAPAPPAWSSHGPAGGTVLALAAAPDWSAVYAGTVGAGVFASSDGGRTWRRSSAGLPPDTNVLRLEAAPSRPATLYLEAADGQRVFRSDDRGAHWTAAAPDNGAVQDLDVDPTDARTVYLTTLSGLLRSTDGGASWGSVGGLQAPSQLAIAPSARDVLYVFDSGYLRRSADAGRTWSVRSTSSDRFDSLAVDPHDPNTLYGGAPDGLFRSTDGGAHWARTSGALPTTEALDFAFAGGTIYAAVSYGGVLRSTDGGAHWVRTGAGLPHESAHTVVVSGGRVLAGLERRGVWARTATHWLPASRGLFASEARALAADPRSAHAAYAGTNSEGVFWTGNDGRSWSARGLVGRNVESLAVDPAAPRVLYAGTDRGVYRSANAGRSWRRARGGLPARIDVRSVAIAPSAHRVVYAATFSNGLWRSRDGGRSWRATSLPATDTATAVAVDPRRAATIWVSTRGLGIVRSTDGGHTWKQGAGFPTFEDTERILVDPLRRGRLYAAGDSGGLWVSGDAGATWSRIVTPVPWILGLALGRGVLYAGGFDTEGHGGVFRSADGGRTWSNLTGGMTTTWIAALALGRDGELYAGTTAYGRQSGGGVFTARLGGR